jgi:hypothetical protein
MTTELWTISLFCRVDDAMRGVKKHPQAVLYPSEITTRERRSALRSRP